MPADTLAEWTSVARLRDDAVVSVRPLRPEDRVREIAFINSLSERTRYLRLLAPLRFLSPHLLDQLMDVDYHGRMAFVAAVQHDGVEEFIGIARYGQTDEPGTIELGVTVTDAWQRRGVARLLIDRLLRYAAWRGFERVCGLVLPENGPMLVLAQALGFHVSRSSTDGLMHISKALGSATAGGSARGAGP